MNDIRAAGAIFANLDGRGPRRAANQRAVYPHHVVVAQRTVLRGEDIRRLAIGRGRIGQPDATAVAAIQPGGCAAKNGVLSLVSRMFCVAARFAGVSPGTSAACTHPACPDRARAT